MSRQRIRDLFFSFELGALTFERALNAGAKGDRFNTAVLRDEMQAAVKQSLIAWEAGAVFVGPGHSQ
jgi:hypothetical protein